MKFFTHLAFAFLVGLFCLDFFSVTNSILFMVVVLVSALFVDIDHPDSKVGRFFKPVGWLFTHRGFFHSLLAMGIFALIPYLIFHDKFVVIAVLVGYSSHLVLDALNHQGIAFFYPLKNRLTGFVKSGGVADYILLLTFIGLCLWKLMCVFF